MKRFLCILLALIFMFSVACSPPADKPTDRTNADTSSALVSEMKVEYNSDAVDWTIDKEGRVFIADKDRITMYDNDGKKTDVVKEGLEFCTCIALDNKTIYVWDDKSASLKLFGLDGKSIGEYPVELKSGKIKRIYAAGKDIFLLRQIQAALHGNQMLVFDIAAQSLRELNFKNVIGFCGYKERQLLIGVSDKSYTRFIVYDWTKDKNLKEYEATTFCTDFFYNEDDNLVYYLPGSNSINTLDLSSGVLNSFYRSEFKSLRKLYIYYPYCFSFGPVEAKVCKIDISKYLGLNSKVEHVVFYSPFSIDNTVKMRKWQDIVEEKYPDIKIDFQSLGSSEYINRLKLKLLASESEPDIFYLNRNEADDFVKNSAIIDLGKYGSIVKRFDSFINGIKRNCTIGEVLAGIPYLINVNAWGVNTELAEKLNLQIPQGVWPLEEFYLLAKRARADLNGDGTKDSYIAAVEARFPFFLIPYISSHIGIAESKVDIDTSQLAKLLAFWKQMLDEGLLLPVQHEENKKIDNILFNNKIMVLMEGNEHLVPLPVIDKSNPLYVNDLYMLCINKYSKKADLAAELLALYLSDEVQLLSPIDAVLEDLDSYTQPKEKFLGTLSNNANKTLYKELMKDSYYRFFFPDFNMFFGDTVDQCIGGRITPDAAAKAIVDKAKMIIGE